MGKALSHKRQDEGSGADAYGWAGVPEAVGAVQDPTQEGGCPGRWVPSPDLALRAERRLGQGQGMGGRNPLSARSSAESGRPQGALLEPRSHRSEGASSPPERLLLVRVQHRVGATPRRAKPGHQGHVLSVGATETVLKRAAPSREGTRHACEEVTVSSVSTETLFWGRKPRRQAGLWELDTTLLQACQETNGFSNTGAERWWGADVGRRPMEGTRLPGQLLRVDSQEGIGGEGSLHGVPLGAEDGLPENAGCGLKVQTQSHPTS